MADELNDQRVEVRWKVTQGDDWFRPFRVLDESDVDVTATCQVVAQIRVARSSGATVMVPVSISPVTGGRWDGYHALHADRDDTDSVSQQVGDWEMEIIPPDSLDMARTVVGGPLVVAPQTAVRS